MTTGQLFILGAIVALALGVVVEHLWHRRWWTRVIEQNGVRHEAKIKPHEAREWLQIEAMLHEATGWTVNEYPRVGMLRVEKGDTTRWLWVRPPGGTR